MDIVEERLQKASGMRGSPSSPISAEEGISLREYWQIIVKRRWTIITFSVIVVTTVTIYSFTQKPVFTATATLEILKESPRILTFDEVGVAPTASDEFVKTQHQLLRSRTLAQLTIDALQLQSHPEFSDVGKTIHFSFDVIKNTVKDAVTNFFGRLFSRKGRDVNQSAPSLENSDVPEDRIFLVNHLLGKLEVEPIKDTRLVRIKFTTFDRELSARLANTWVNLFIERHLEQKFQGTSQAEAWLSKQLRELQAKLETSEERLHAFARGKEILTVGESQDLLVQKLRGLTDALTKAQNERIAKAALLRQVQGKDFRSFPPMLETDPIIGWKEEYYKLDGEYRRLSETYKAEYPKMVQLREKMDGLRQRLEIEVRRIVGGIEADYETASTQEMLLQKSVEEQRQTVVKLGEDLIQHNILRREVDSNRALYLTFLEKLKQAGVSAEYKISNIRPAEKAEIPCCPSGPGRSQAIAFSMVISLVLGIGIAFFFEHLDNTIKTSEEAERFLGLLVLGRIPALSSVVRRNEGKNEDGQRSPYEVISYQDMRSPLREAFNNLRTSILFSSVDHPPKSILFASSQEKEGKTSLAMNTAIVLAQLGVNVLLLDSDLRMAGCHEPLKLERSPGLSDLLTGNAELASVIRKTSIPNLSLIPSGQAPLNATELLASGRMRETLEVLSLRYAYVILDSSPISGYADAAILSTLVEGVIFVVHAGKTPRGKAQEAVKRLVDVNARLIGAVLNQVDGRDEGYYYSASSGKLT